MPLITFEDYDGNPPDRSDEVIALIADGAPRSIISRDIERKLEISGVKVRACVHHLRCTGHAIGSSGDGYFLATKPEQLATSIMHGWQRVRSIAQWARALEQTSDDMLNRCEYEQGDLDL